MNHELKQRPALPAYRMLPPSECSPDELRAFAQRVREAGQVVRVGLESQIERAARLGFAWVGDALAGVAGVKRPSDARRERVFSKAGVLALKPQYPLEYGWVYVIPPFRGHGIATELLEKLLATTGEVGVFATSSATNVAMHHVLKRASFVVAGTAFPGVQMGRLSLWLRSVK